MLSISMEKRYENKKQMLWPLVGPIHLHCKLMCSAEVVTQEFLIAIREKYSSKTLENQYWYQYKTLKIFLRTTPGY
uniref:Uncharacterized protein n=1 Tax=Rhizophora mucronata TaxID=61149 RepID=A0A2P2JV71_RHIMU